MKKQNIFRVFSLCILPLLVSACASKRGELATYELFGEYWSMLGTIIVLIIIGLGYAISYWMASPIIRAGKYKYEETETEYVETGEFYDDYGNINKIITQETYGTGKYKTYKITPAEEQQSIRKRHNDINVGATCVCLISLGFTLFMNSIMRETWGLLGVGLLIGLFGIAVPLIYHFMNPVSADGFGSVLSSPITKYIRIAYLAGYLLFVPLMLIGDKGFGEIGDLFQSKHSEGIIVVEESIPESTIPAEPVSITPHIEKQHKIEYHSIRECRYYQGNDAYYKVNFNFHCPIDIEGAALLPLWEEWLHDNELSNDIRNIANEFKGNHSVNQEALCQEICKSPEYIDAILLNTLTTALFGQQIDQIPTTQNAHIISVDFIVREQLHIPNRLLEIKQKITRGENQPTIIRYIYYDIPNERTLTHEDIFAISKHELANRLQEKYIDEYNGYLYINWGAFCASPNLQIELNKDKAILDLTYYATIRDKENNTEEYLPSFIIELPYKENSDLWGKTVRKLFL